LEVGERLQKIHNVARYFMGNLENEEDALEIKGEMQLIINDENFSNILIEMEKNFNKKIFPIKTHPNINVNMNNKV